MVKSFRWNKTIKPVLLKVFNQILFGTDLLFWMQFNGFIYFKFWYKTDFEQNGYHFQSPSETK